MIVDSCSGPDGTDQQHHSHAFTYEACSAQVEPGARVYAFCVCEDRGTWHYRIYARSKAWSDDEPWLICDMPDSESAALLSSLESVRLPLLFSRGPKNSVHEHRALKIRRDGAQLTISWDTGDNALIKSLAPMLRFLEAVDKTFSSSFEANRKLLPYSLYSGKYRAPLIHLQFCENEDL